PTFEVDRYSMCTKDPCFFNERRTRLHERLRMTQFFDNRRRLIHLTKTNTGRAFGNDKREHATQPFFTHTCLALWSGIVPLDETRDAFERHNASVCPRVRGRTPHDLFAKKFERFRRAQCRECSKRFVRHLREVNEQLRVPGLSYRSEGFTCPNSLLEL